MIFQCQIMTSFFDTLAAYEYKPYILLYYCTRLSVAILECILFVTNRIINKTGTLLDRVEPWEFKISVCLIVWGMCLKKCVNNIFNTTTLPTLLFDMIFRKVHGNDRWTGVDYWNTLLDFGGQLVYYSTHPMYLSKRCLYFLVFSLDMGLEKHVKEDDVQAATTRKTVMGNSQ